MVQQGDADKGSAGQGGDWWDHLYEEGAPDTGPPARAADTLDDRFDSAARTVGGAGADPPEAAPVAPLGAPLPPPDHSTQGTLRLRRDAGVGRREPDPREEPQDRRPGAPGELRDETGSPVGAPPDAAPDDTAGTLPAPPAQQVPPAQPAPPGQPEPVERLAPPTQPEPVERPAPPAPAAEQPAAPPAHADPEERPAQPAHPAQNLAVPPAPLAEQPAAPPAQRSSPPGPEASPRLTPSPRPAAAHLGDRPPTYQPEPTALPSVTAAGLADLVPDTALDGAAYGTMTLRCATTRGDSARFRGEQRRDALLTARFGAGDSALVLVAVATGARGGAPTHLAAHDACLWIGASVGRSHARLDQDIREGRRGSLKSGLHRLTGRMYGLMRAKSAELGLGHDEYTATLRCLLLPADPACRIRVFFGTGQGGLFRLRDGSWQDIEPEPGGAEGGPVVGFGSRPKVPDPRAEPPASPPTLADPAGEPVQPFSFRASVAQPGDTLLMASAGLAEPLRGEPALAGELAQRWQGAPPGLAAYLADVQLRVKGYADDRTAVAVWES
ncbi:protein phosphatase 2C domain-containing protein [Streptomyces sp. NPDC051940]|uniref:protein phosphatase 2C domain-containing protein n=1 Tax=Streptomyces sp. NPDC051940 TaxID=3155675 RepID=UPI00343E90C5